MNKISKKVSFLEKLKIYGMVFNKILRGLLKSMFLKQVALPVFIGKHVSFSHMNNIVVGKYCKFEDYSEIQGLSKEPLIFGNKVTIGRATLIRPSSYYGVGNLGAGIEIGDNSSIGPSGYIGCSGKIIIGENVMIGPKVSMFAENHNFKDKYETIKEQGVNNKGIIIEDNCWIGSNVIILDGVRVGSGTVIGAGTIVTKSIPRNSIVVDKRDKYVRDR